MAQNLIKAAAASAARQARLGAAVLEDAARLFDQLSVLQFEPKVDREAANNLRDLEHALEALNRGPFAGIEKWIGEIKNNLGIGGGK